MVKKINWLSKYLETLRKYDKRGEHEWRVAFREHFLIKGLGYPSKLVDYERQRTDLRITDENGISHIVIETKNSPKQLNYKKTLEQAQTYLKGGEAFLILASPRKVKVYSPAGNLRFEFCISQEGIEECAYLDLLTYQSFKDQLAIKDFREGNYDSGFIPVTARRRKNLQNLVECLNISTKLLLGYLREAWPFYLQEFERYKVEHTRIEEGRKEIELSGKSEAEKYDLTRQLQLREWKLREQYSVAIEIFENSYPRFKKIQPFSKEFPTAQREKQLKETYFTDVVYAALNRILFIRICEDKNLVNRKISNDGIRAWRELVTNLRERYQGLLDLAFKDTSGVYQHFFQRSIFDWYLDADSNLHQVLEKIFFLLNAFDLSQLDSNLLAELYQNYLPRDKRKKLGEFYTPIEVTQYILKNVGYGEGRLLDFACGSGGFIVPAARMRLNQLKKRGVGPKLRLEAIRDIVGLDINPFASNIAEMNMIFLILETYLEAKEEDPKYHLEDLSIYTIDSLLGRLTNKQWEIEFRPYLKQQIEAKGMIAALEKYRYVVGNPPYIRNERLPENMRNLYKKVFADIITGNIDIFAFFLRMGLDWLEKDGTMGVIVSLGLADAGTTAKLRKFLSQYTIVKIVPLEWAPDVFVSNVNPILLFIRKKTPSPNHKVKIVHGIRSIKELNKNKVRTIAIPQRRWLRLAEDIDCSWRVEVTSEDLPILEKMKKHPKPLKAGYGMTLRDEARGRKLISHDRSMLENPYPLLDGRELKSWSIEWQNRWLDYQANLISSPKPIEYFHRPIVFSPRISLTLQAVVNQPASSNPASTIPFVCRDTVMVVEPDNHKTLEGRPYLIAGLLNSLPVRTYSFLMLRAGVMEGSRRCTFYPRSFKNLPLPIEKCETESALLDRIESRSVEAHQIAGEMFSGDNNVLNEAKDIVASKTKAFGLTPNADLSSYIDAFHLEKTSVDSKGFLKQEGSLSRVKGNPRILRYILSFADLQGLEELSKEKLEGFPVPTNENILKEALKILTAWEKKKPTLGDKLRNIEREIDELCLDAFTDLTEREKKYIKKRANTFPMNEVLATKLPGAPTRYIGYKRWEEGARYK